MRHLKRIAIALMVLGLTNGLVSVNLEPDQPTAVSVTVQLQDCSPLTCGGGGS